MDGRSHPVRSTLAAIPRVHLGAFPTPLHRGDALGRLVGIDGLWLKRDDLTGYSWGGNKVRAIEFLIGDALERHATDVVLAAGASSNFAAILAMAAAGHGLGVHQVAYGTPPTRPVAALAVARASGASAIFTGSADRGSMETVADEVAGTLARDGRLPYRIPRGGASPVGALGYLAAAIELIDQVDHTDGLRGAAGRPLDLILPLGSGGSTAGLLAGLVAFDVPWVVQAMSVSRSPEEIEEQLVNTAARCLALVGITADPVAITEQLCVRDARGAGFGASTREEDALADRVSAATGLLIDPTYNAKAVLALAGTALAGTALDGRPSIYVCTGGALGTVDRLLAAHDHAQPTPPPAFV